MERLDACLRVERFATGLCSLHVPGSDACEVGLVWQKVCDSGHIPNHESVPRATGLVHVEGREQRRSPEKVDDVMVV